MPLLLVPLLLLPLLTGCISVSFNYSRESIHEPIADETFEPLNQRFRDSGQPVDLQDCMDSMGAPNLVWESPRGPALAYLWHDHSQWGFDVSYAFERFVSARINFRDLDEDINGLVLLFDDSLHLKEVRRGYVSQIIREVGRQRPAVMHEEEKEAE